MSYPENSVGRPLPMEADPDAMNDKDEVRSACHTARCSSQTCSAAETSPKGEPCSSQTCFQGAMYCLPPGDRQLSTAQLK